MFNSKLRLALYFLFFIIAFINLGLSSFAQAAGPVINSITLSDPDSGSTEYANNTTIRVSIDANGVPTQMILSKYNDFHDAAWAVYASPANFTFETPTINGARTVYCKLKNAGSEASNTAQDSINIDTFRPSLSTANSGLVNTTHIDIMFSDYIMVGADNPANYTITNGAAVLAAQLVWVPSASLYKYRLATSPQTAGMQYTVTISSGVQDPAGNLIDPNARTFTYTAVSAVDTTKPQVDSFSIEGANAYTENRDISILMTESDTGGLVKKWLITAVLSTPPSSAFTLTSRPDSCTLSEGDGAKTLYAWVMDDSGNISSYNPSRTIDSIILDQTSPLANAGSAQTVEMGVQVSFDGSGSSDNYQINRYVWDFGDSSPAVEGITASHAYALNGSYLVTLTVYDSAGNEANNTVTVTVGPHGSPTYLKVGGPNSDYNTIMDAMAHIAEGGIIYVYPGGYYENVHMKEGVTLKGENNNTTVLRGKIFFKEVRGTVDNLTILFNEEEILSFSNARYPELKLCADSGITVINSSPVIKNCIIKPDLESISWQGGNSPPFGHYGKAIQIWKLYDSPAIAPSVENNIIADNDCGIYYFSQASGGDITGLIKNNTFYNNNTGILLRMHKENPEIKNNIIYGSPGSLSNIGIFIAYEDDSLFETRKSKIHHNDIWAYSRNYWLDETGTAFDLAGTNGNISEDPLFADAAHGYFSLDPDSPCIGTADDGGNIGAVIEDNPLAPSPTVDPLPSITNRQYLAISGTKAAGTSIWINDEEIILLDDQTVWRAEYYNLGADGEKTLSITTRNAEGEESVPVITALVLDTKRPVLNIASPENGAAVTSTPVTVTGTVDEEAAVIVNGIPAASAGGSFTIDMPLTAGENLITAVATDAAGNQSLADYIIIALNIGIPTITGFTPPDNARLVEGSAILVTANASDPDSTDLWYRFFVKGLLRQDWAKGRNAFSYYVSQAEVGSSAIKVEVADSDPNGHADPNIVSQSSRIYNFRKPILPAALE